MKILNCQDAICQRFAKAFPFVDHTHGFNEAGLSRLLTENMTVLEVGSWLGGSARWFAKNPHVSHVTCVDHWDRNKVENWTPGRHPESWMNFMYEQFLANCVHAGVADKISVVRAESHEAARALRAGFGLVYLDGAHRTEKVRQDLEDYFSLAHIVCGDDWLFDREPENVRKAVTDFAAKHKLEVHNDGNLWWYV